MRRLPARYDSALVLFSLTFSAFSVGFSLATFLTTEWHWK